MTYKLKVTLSATDRVQAVNGVPCRAWEGETASGTPVVAYVALIEPQTFDPGRLAEFEEQLKHVETRRELVSFDLRMVT